MVELTDRTYATGVTSSTAVLPDPPAYWSYSALKEIEACPRRYALGRARYPDFWDSAGYPKAPSAPALFGEVVHAGLEAIVQAMVAAGCSSTTSVEAVAVLRDLGGYTAVVESALTARLRQFEGNPRVDDERRRRLERDLSDRIPDARAQLQAYLARGQLRAGQHRGPPVSSSEAARPAGRGSAKGGAAFGRRPASLGANAELTLASDDLRLMGRVDLLTVQPDRADITDYKTGAEHPSHRGQLLAYAVLWEDDCVVNPDRIPLGTLTAAYSTHDVILDVPERQAIEGARAAIATCVVAADAAAKAPVPVARPGERCATCHVRQLCDDYWTSHAPDPAVLPDGTWFDLEGRVGDRHGAKSWWLTETRSRAAVLVRTPGPSVSLCSGRTVRLVGVRRVVDPDEPDSLIAAMGADTEVFMLADA